MLGDVLAASLHWAWSHMVAGVAVHTACLPLRPQVPRGSQAARGLGKNVLPAGPNRTKSGWTPVS